MEKPGRRAALHYLPALADLPLGILMAAVGTFRPAHPAPYLYYIILTAAQTLQLVLYGWSSLRLARAYGSGGRANWLSRAAWAVISGYAIISALGWFIIAQASIEEILSRPVDFFPGLNTFALVSSMLLIWTLCLCALWGGERASEDGKAMRKYGGRPLSEQEALSIIARAGKLIEAEEDLSSGRVDPRALAERLGLPYYLLSRAVNEREGQSVLEFVNAFRVDRAKAILETRPEASVLDACFDSGFLSKSTFNATFRKRLGQTPTQYRSSIRNPNRSEG